MGGIDNSSFQACWFPEKILLAASCAHILKDTPKVSTKLKFKTRYIFNLKAVWFETLMFHYFNRDIRTGMDESE